MYVCAHVPLSKLDPPTHTIEHLVPKAHNPRPHTGTLQAANTNAPWPSLLVSLHLELVVIDAPALAGVEQIKRLPDLLLLVIAQLRALQRWECGEEEGWVKNE